MTIQILHRPGIGEWPHGVVVQVEDRCAKRLIHDGYAIEVKPKGKKAREDADGGTGRTNRARIVI